MGLDMYMFKRKKAVEEVAYWRKANQVREWFANTLENFHDNGDTPVTREELEELVDTCKKVLSNHELASELLPTSAGFFFGSQAYDDGYFYDLEITVEMLTKIIEETDWETEEVLYSEWY